MLLFRLLTVLFLMLCSPIHWTYVIILLMSRPLLSLVLYYLDNSDNGFIKSCGNVIYNGKLQCDKLSIIVDNNYKKVKHYNVIKKMIFLKNKLYEYDIRFDAHVKQVFTDFYNQVSESTIQYAYKNREMIKKKFIELGKPEYGTLLDLIIMSKMQNKQSVPTVTNTRQNIDKHNNHNMMMLKQNDLGGMMNMIKSPNFMKFMNSPEIAKMAESMNNNDDKILEEILLMINNDKESNVLVDSIRKKITEYMDKKMVREMIPRSANTKDIYYVSKKKNKKCNLFETIKYNIKNEEDDNISEDEIQVKNN